jgi:hypothetical protein
MLAVSSLSFVAPKAEAATKFSTISGQVVKIDTKARTLLISDRSNERLYLVSMPEGSTLKITWGRYMRMVEPSFGDVYTKDRVEIRCFRTDPEHLAQLENGRKAIKLTAASSK